MPRLTKHTGTDCQHMGTTGQFRRGQGICLNCREPLFPRPIRWHQMAPYHDLEALGYLLDRNGKLLDPLPKFSTKGMQR